ncbi:MAG TPA: polysaccharide deacetylase family protein [Candidatus Hydrogenedentes bacterium]|nr:polysaccharide deacetylase family protein [Candidatus Hydrogenedentota bacterium]HOK89838.1 polysaccharide deacetylase family protein [Candidatus Hydrogenedentota bacterium]
MMTRIGVVVMVLALGAAISGRADDAVTYAEKLGWPKGARVVIFHVDDAGMHHDANMGAIEAMEKGVATSASIMFPCPWVPEIVAYAKANPDKDFGMHCTLTSEWKSYRWGPVAGKPAVPGLVDEEGCLWHSAEETAQHATADEVERELRAQLDRAMTMGFTPTHLDTHMGTVYQTPEFLERYIKLGAEKGIPVMVPGGHCYFLLKEEPRFAELVGPLGEKVWSLGLPVLDDLHTGYGSKGPEDKKRQILEFLRECKPGVTQFIVHCTRPSDNFAHVTGSGPTRLAELEAMLDPEVRATIEREGIILTTWRELKQRRGQAK